MLIKSKIYLLIIFSISTAFLNAQKSFTTYDLLKINSVSETSVSPDGKFVAFTLRSFRQLTDTPGSDYQRLYLFDVEKEISSELIPDNVSITSLSWSPDSKSVFFISRLEGDKVSQVYSLNIDGSSPIRLTNEDKKVESYQLNPEGNKLAYVSSESLPKEKQNLLTEGYDAEIFEEELLNLNLFIKDLNSNELKQITKDVAVFEFDWSPDGKKIAALIAEKNLIDYKYMFKRVYLIDPENQSMEKIIENPGKITDIKWSPDGKHLAFVAGVDINDPVSGSLYISEIPAPKNFSEIKNYTKNFIGSVVKVKWKDNSTVLFSAEEGVDVTLSEIKIGETERKLLIEPELIVFDKFSYKNGIISLDGSTPKHPKELYLYNISNDNLEKKTSYNSWLNDYQLAKQEKIIYEARDGLKIEAILVYPLNFEEGKKYPLINYIHGGPESAVNNGWVTSYNIWGQIAAAKDFFVIMPNYRASSGRGVEFSKMDFGNPVAEEFEDIIDGINFLIEKGYVDKNRVGIGGGSYGGYFSAWAATKETEHFAASVVFVGVSDQISKRFTSDIPYELYHVHWGLWVHEDFQLHLDRSPVKYAEQSKTATLILHGKEDTRVHPSQSLELYRALKLHGNAPVRLVLYPKQGHGNSKNTSKIDYSLRTMEWFEYYLNSDKPKDKMPNKYLNFPDDSVIN